MATLTKRGAGAAAGTGTTWTNLGANGTDGTPPANPATYCVWTSSATGAVATLEISGYDFSSIPDGSTINSVTLIVRNLCSVVARYASVRFQPYENAVALGSIATGTLTTSAHDNSATFPVTLAQLKSATFKSRVTITRAATTSSATFSVDHVDVTVNYTPPAQTWTGSTSTIGVEGVSGEFILTAPSLPKISTLIDDFATTVDKVGKWSGATSPEVVWEAGRAKLPCLPGTTYLQTPYNAYDLSESSIFLKIVPAEPNTGQLISGIAFDIDGINGIQYNLYAGQITGWKYVAGNSYNLGYHNYDPVAHAWWRIRATSGSIYLETSPDSQTWTELIWTNESWSISSVMFGIATTSYETPISDTYVDNVNVAVIPITPQTWSGSIATIGTAGITGLFVPGAITWISTTIAAIGTAGITGLFVPAPVTWSGSIVTIGISAQGGSPETPSGAAETFFDNWETGNNTKWTNVTGAPVVSATSAYAGSYGVRLAPVNSDSSLGTSTTKWTQTGRPWFSFIMKFKFVSLPIVGSAEGASLITIQNLTQIANADIFLNKDSLKIIFDLHGPSFEFWDSEVIPVVGQWYTVRLRGDFSGTTWSLQCRVDDIIGPTIYSPGRAASSTRALRLGPVGSVAQTWTMDVDDLRIVVDNQDVGWLNDTSRWIPGPVTWSGSTATVGVSGQSGTFTVAAISWSGSIATIGSTGITGSFSVGPVTWIGSTATVGVAGFSDVFVAGTTIWSGSTATIGVSGQSGPFVLAAIIWSGSIATIGATGITSSFTVGPVIWSGNTSTVGISGQSGVWISVNVWQGSIATFGVAGQTGTFVIGTFTWIGSIGTVGSAGISGGFNLEAYVWPGSIGRLGLESVSGVFVPGIITWSGSIGTVGAVGIQVNNALFNTSIPGGATTPDVVFNASGNIWDFRAWVQLDDYTPTVINNFIRQYHSTQNGRAFWFQLLTNGTLRLGLRLIPVGGAGTSITSVGAVPVANGQKAWLRALLDLKEGTANCSVSFYYSIEDSPTPTNWTQIGATITGTQMGLMTNSPQPVGFGWATDTLNEPAVGRLYSGSITVDDVPIMSPSPYLQPVDTASFIDTQGNVWTVKGSARILDHGFYPGPVSIVGSISTIGVEGISENIWIITYDVIGQMNGNEFVGWQYGSQQIEEWMLT
jgi:hypothetical protein